MKDPKLQGKINLVQYQKDCLNEAFRTDENGNYVYSVVVWSDVKKSAKSTIAALASLYIADIHPYAENYHIANDLKQADSRVGKYARRAVSLSPSLTEKFRTRGYQILHLSNGSIVESVPIDPEGEAGSNADFIQFSELWGATDDAKTRMFQEMTLSPTKFGRSLRWIESYAGYTEESEVLYDLWRMGVKEGELLWPDKLYPVTGGPGGEIVDYTPLEVYKNEEARLLCLWNTQPRCPWQSKEYYDSERAVLLPLEFNRMHGNLWVSNTDTYLPMEWWYACKRTQEEMPEIPKNWPMIVAMDAAVSNDCFGITMMCRHPDRRKYPNDAILVKEYKWEPKKLGGKIDFQGTDEQPGPEKVLRKLISEYNVVEVAYDPYQLHDLASRLTKEHIAFFRIFPQGGGKHSRLWSDSDLRDMIRERRIWYTDAPYTTEHLQHADAQIDKEDRKVRIVKRVDKLKIDLAVCLSMNAYELFRLNI